MRKIILAVVVCVSLFGSTEESFKEKYDYLVQKYSQAVKDTNQMDFSNSIISTYGKSRQEVRDEELESQRQATEHKEAIEKAQENVVKYSEKLMDLKFDIKSDLKVLPAWFIWSEKKLEQ